MTRMNLSNVFSNFVEHTILVLTSHLQSCMTLFVFLPSKKSNLSADHLTLTALPCQAGAAPKALDLAAMMLKKAGNVGVAVGDLEVYTLPPR